jgi:hypothetical protein
MGKGAAIEADIIFGSAGGCLGSNFDQPPHDRRRIGGQRRNLTGVEALNAS